MTPARVIRLPPASAPLAPPGDDDADPLASADRPNRPRPSLRGAPERTPAGQGPPAALYNALHYSGLKRRRAMRHWRREHAVTGVVYALQAMSDAAFRKRFRTSYGETRLLRPPRPPPRRRLRPLRTNHSGTSQECGTRDLSAPAPPRSPCVLRRRSGRSGGGGSL